MTIAGTLPFKIDPLEWFTGNDSDYHDIHRQVHIVGYFTASCTELNHRQLESGTTSHNRPSCIGVPSLGRG